MVEQRQLGPLREPRRLVECTHTAWRFDSFPDSINSSTHPVVSWTRPSSVKLTEPANSRPTNAIAWGPYVII